MVQLLLDHPDCKKFTWIVEAGTYWAKIMQVMGDNDFGEWSDDNVIEEFGWWVSGSRLGPEDEGGPRQEWIDDYWKEA